MPKDVAFLKAKFKKLEETLSTANTRKSQLEGKIETFYQQLEQEGFSSEEEAKNKIETNEEEVQRLEEEASDLYSKLEAEYGW